MSDDAKQRTQTPPSGGETPVDADPEISLKPFLDTLWVYRKVIWAIVATVAGLYLVFVLGVFLITPVQRSGSLQFRLLFEGAESGQYPNGSVFSASEIVAAPVLTEVYRVDDLQRYWKYDQFKNSVVILQSNPEIDILAAEYASRLADTKLSPVDRARIEEEFKQKRQALVDPVYTISMLRNERLTTMPPDLVNKVLLDILRTWSEQAELRKGGMQYNVDVLSPSILQREMLEREDYLVAIDVFRAKTSRVLATIDEIAKLPGAKTIRVGDNHVTLAEVRAQLEDVVRFELEPLLGVIRSEGITRDLRALSLYASNQLFQLRQEQQESAERVNALQASVRTFSTQGGTGLGDARAVGSAGTGSSPVTPLLDQSFLDRIMALSTAKADSDYKRKLTDRVIDESNKMASRSREVAYYDDLVKELKGRSAGARAVGSPELVAMINRRSADAFDEIVKGITMTEAIYREVSALNLSPTTTLFAVTSPFTQQTNRSLTAWAVGLYFVLIVALTLIATLVGSLTHNFIKLYRHGE